MRPIEQAVVDHFTENRSHYAQPDSQPVFLAPFTLLYGNVMLVCDCQEEAERLIVHAVSPFSAPVQNRMVVTEFITWVNCDLAISAFTTDYRDAKCSFRCVDLA